MHEAADNIEEILYIHAERTELVCEYGAIFSSQPTYHQSATTIDPTPDRPMQPSSVSPHRFRYALCSSNLLLISALTSSTRLVILHNFSLSLLPSLPANLKYFNSSRAVSADFNFLCHSWSRSAGVVQL